MDDTRIRVHMIGQAHLDPVWLWPWQDGLDETLATCRTACNLLDAFPDFVFTKGEAWAYSEIERLEPALFERIRAHIEAGRWAVVGGWWIQPDCNAPSRVGLERQIGVGRRYLLDRFGHFPEVAYNVDSFGHSAALPELMREAGQRFYVMMRPQEHERDLPARVFRWRGHPDGPEVVVFRIAGPYCTGNDGLTEAHVRRSLESLPSGTADTMCFFGVGDHGGGPTAAQIEWVRGHRDAIEGCRLVFSSPAAFFGAIEDSVDALPLVVGDLQYHAIGCYSVHRGIKTRTRRAELALAAAERSAAARPGDGSDSGALLERAWRRVAFAQFHDTLGGTAVDSAYPQVYDQLGEAMTVADDLLQYGLRRRLSSLPDDACCRVVLQNTSDGAYDDYVEIEPWTQWRTWEPAWRLRDEAGRVVPYQRLPAEALFPIPRLLCRVRIQPGSLCVLAVDPSAAEAEDVRDGDEHVFEGGAIRMASGPGVDLEAAGRLDFPDGLSTSLPYLALIDDSTDNWSHGVDRFPKGPEVQARWNAASVLHGGELMAALYRTGTIGRSGVREEWRVYRDCPFVELRLVVNWVEVQKLLKLVWRESTGGSREDGIAGGALLRPNDGQECPLQDWTLCTGHAAGALGVACPDVFALDATSERLRLTLLRSPLVTHHEPFAVSRADARATDRGEHAFRFRFHTGDVARETLLADVRTMQSPPLKAGLTRGMPW